MDEFARPRVVVADDDPTVRVLAQQCLAGAGFDVLLAEDGEQALRHFDAGMPEIALLDVGMPGLDGFDVCRRVRERFDATEVALVMLTGQHDVDSVNEAYAAGATDFISKPVHWPLLPHRLRYALRSTRSARELRANEARTRAIVEAIPDTILTLDESGRCLASNREPAGATAERCIGRHITELMPAPAATEWMTALRMATATSRLQTFVYALPAGETHTHYEARIVPVADRELVAVIRNVTQQREQEHEIRRLAFFDSLTGLPNRRFIVEQIDQRIRAAAGTGLGAAVLFLDLDGFKRINDSMGHAFGDELLRGVAERLRRILRAQDRVSRSAGRVIDLEVARLGGDEFTIALSDVGQRRDVDAVAERICEALRQPFRIEGSDISITASLGMAMYPVDGDTADALLRSADTAMYHAKEAGRDRSVGYHASMTTTARQRLDCEQGLRFALERDEFELFYQPLMRAGGDRALKFEALLRWRRDGALLPPGDFIPVAEQSGLIVPIGRWVLREAARQGRAWHDRGHPEVRIAVNVSGRQLRDAAFVDDVLGALADTGFPAAALELELTESVLLDTGAAAIDKLVRLRGHGITFAIDDFGTGYSSMSYLKQFPISTVKVDRAFVKGLPASADDRAITTAIVSLAHSLRMEVVAEGVESQSQADCLHRLGCDVLQGYLIARPVPADVADRWLSEGPAALEAVAASLD